MPDDLSDLLPEFERNLARANGEPVPDEIEEDEPPPAPLPRAMVSVPIITTLWIRWLPLSIMFFGLSFIAWTIVMIVQVGRYHDGLTKAEARAKAVEVQLEQLKKQLKLPPEKP